MLLLKPARIATVCSILPALLLTVCVSTLQRYRRHQRIPLRSGCDELVVHLKSSYVRSMRRAAALCGLPERQGSVECVFS